MQKANEGNDMGRLTISMMRVGGSGILLLIIPRELLEATPL
jgi:hypothetical protein